METLPHEKGFHISWEQIHRDSRALAWRLEKMAPETSSWKAVVAVTRGGMVPAMVVARELAHVLSGGDTDINKTLSEEDLYKLELDAFMKLIETKETQDRIKHTLATGKPLIN